MQEKKSENYHKNSNKKILFSIYILLPFGRNIRVNLTICADDKFIMYHLYWLQTSVINAFFSWFCRHLNAFITAFQVRSLWGSFPMDKNLGYSSLCWLTMLQNLQMFLWTYNNMCLDGGCLFILLISTFVCFIFLYYEFPPRSYSEG